MNKAKGKDVKETTEEPKEPILSDAEVDALLRGVSKPNYTQEQIKALMVAYYKDGKTIQFYNEDKLGGMIRNLDTWLKDIFSQFKGYKD